MSINLTQLHTSALPEGAQLRRIAGDWMRNGYIENLGRPSRLEVVVIDGKGYVVDDNGYIANGGGELTPVVLDAEGEIPIGGDWTFSPDEGEMARAGLA